MNPIEDTVFEWLIRAAAVERHVLWLFEDLPDGRHRYGPPGPARDAGLTSFVRREALGCMGSALIDGYDGSELARKPRNADEHRVARVYVGSGLLRDVGEFLTAIDWQEVRHRCQAEADARAAREMAA